MKVIFLDFDGVIRDIHDSCILVNPKFVFYLKKVIDETGALVVVSSSHRDDACFIEPLEELGISIYDYTPLLPKEPLEIRREAEISLYLECHKEVEQFVIIEDDYVMQELYEHQVFIEYSDGFDVRYITPAIRILNGNLGFYPPDYDRTETFQERIKRLFPHAILDENLQLLNSRKFY